MPLLLVVCCVDYFAHLGEVGVERACGAPPFDLGFKYVGAMGLAEVVLGAFRAGPGTCSKPDVGGLTAVRCARSTNSQGTVPSPCSVSSVMIKPFRVNAAV
ncbi:MAG: hypothetical protein ACRDPT_17955 [Streptomycetales bacterium]